MSKQVKMETTSVIGQVFNKLTILEELPSEINSSGKYDRLVKVKCSCGNESTKKLKYLRSGETKSCGNCVKVLHSEKYNGVDVVLSEASSDEKDLIGREFGRLKVIDAGFCAKNRRLLRVECSCGVQKFVFKTRVINNKTASCGCYSLESVVERSTSHDMYHTKTYTSWSNMKTRCNNPNLPQFKDYGGRGISYCEKWETFEGFFEDMGHLPEGLTLERKDVNKGYCKENCIWADRFVQAANKRKKKTNTSGKTGVFSLSNGKRWKSSLTFRGQVYNLGVFSNFEDAVKAREAAELKYFDFLKE